MSRRLRGFGSGSPLREQPRWGRYDRGAALFFLVGKGGQVY